MARNQQLSWNRRSARLVVVDEGNDQQHGDSCAAPTRPFGRQGAGGQSDRTFVSRQQLVNFLATIDSNLANMRNVLQFLGTFSREINQPLYVSPTSKAGGYPSNNAPVRADCRRNSCYLSIERMDVSPAMHIIDDMARGLLTAAQAREELMALGLEGLEADELIFLAQGGDDVEED